MHMSRVKGRADSAGARDSTDSPRGALPDRQHLVQSKSRSDLAADALPSSAAEIKGGKAAAAAGRTWLPSADWALIVWSKDARLRTTVLVNLSVRLSCTQQGVHELHVAQVCAAMLRVTAQQQVDTYTCKRGTWHGACMPPRSNSLHAL